MKQVISLVIIILNFISCFGQTDEQFKISHEGIHKVEVVEILQTQSYTYLNVKENDSLRWLAMPKTEAEVGELYYYQGGNEMVDFRSTSLDRTFESILFLGGVVKVPSADDNEQKSTAKDSGSATKLDIKVEPLEDGITIDELFQNKEKYEGKSVKIKAKVTQLNESIMGRNWLHLQDGTDYNGNFDLVATSQMIASADQIVIVEGVVVLNKDFGYGYFYDLLLENCKISF